MIHHDDEVTEPVPISIKMTQAIGDNFRKFALPKHAGAVEIIEMPMEFDRDGFVKLALQLFAELGETVAPVFVVRVNVML